MGILYNVATYIFHKLFTKSVCCSRRNFIIFNILIFFSISIVGYMTLSKETSEDSAEQTDYVEKLGQLEQATSKSFDNIHKPIIVWWTPFSLELGNYKKCNDVQCFFTVDRSFWNHSMTKAFMFYGSLFEASDLPLPRSSDHDWALLHEESPKNNYLFLFPEIITLFNHTSTFRRESDYPITTQYLYSLEWLETTKYLVSVELKNKYQRESGLSPIIYVHSDCDPPSDRDKYTKILMKYINVDAYGECLHNKDLPNHLKEPLRDMMDPDFIALIGKYKFALAMENGRCKDYMTEKLWRPLVAGAVPIILGSDSVMEFMPSAHSALSIDNFKNVKELADYLNYLNNNDAEYDKYLTWKHTGVTNEFLKKQLKEREWSVDAADNKYRTHLNFVDGFECFVCKKIHKNINNQNTLKYQATQEHYGCPKPVKFDDNGVPIPNNSLVDDEWNYFRDVAKATRKLVLKNVPFKRSELSAEAGVHPAY